MRIISMTAVFGKLDGETLTLHPGLNVLSAPNEWGKSTWCDFLTVMLYGLDQSADPDLCHPWSGRPMEGKLRVLHEGRDITIRRYSAGLTPMGEFLAWETQTGQAVRELTAENCGQQLLGMDQDLFRKTCLLRAADLQPEEGEEMDPEAVLAAQSMPGDARRLESKLLALQDRCCGSGGQIDECRARLRSTQEDLWEVHTLRKQHDALNARALELERELERLDDHQTTLEWDAIHALRAQLEDARADARTALMLEKALSEKYTDNPNRADAEAKIRQGENLLQELDLSLEEPPSSSYAVPLTAMLTVLLAVAPFLMGDPALLIPCIPLALAMLLICLNLVGRKRRKMIWYNIDQTRRKAKRTELNNFINSWKSQLRVLDELDRARENITRTQARVAQLEAQLRDAQEPEEPEFDDPLSLTAQETLLARQDALQQLEQCRKKLLPLRERLAQLPAEGQLQSRLARLRFRLRELEKTAQAAALALDTLDRSARELQRSRLPRLRRRTAEFLERLTAPWGHCSATGVQQELAGHLALWEALSENCPLVLDDALVRLDRARLERALDLLKDLAGDRQILLLSCQDREKEYLGE